MIKVESIIRKALASRDKYTREQAQILHRLYVDESKFYNPNREIIDTFTTEQYKNLLIDKGIEYVEGTFENKYGKQVNIVVPALIFKSMTKKDIDKLINIQ